MVKKNDTNNQLQLDSFAFSQKGGMRFAHWFHKNHLY